MSGRASFVADDGESVRLGGRALDVNPLICGRTVPSPSTRWQFRTGRSFLLADRAGRKQRMNAPGLVRHLRDPQVEHRAG